MSRIYLDKQHYKSHIPDLYTNTGNVKLKLAYCMFRVNKILKLVLQFEVSEPSIINLKKVSIIEMARLYSALGSFVLLRPKKVKLPT